MSEAFYGEFVMMNRRPQEGPFPGFVWFAATAEERTVLVVQDFDPGDEDHRRADIMQWPLPRQDVGMTSVQTDKNGV